MVQRNLYAASNPITLRVATLQHDAFSDVFANFHDASQPTDRELAGYIRSIAEFPDLIEAIAVSSPVLLKALDKVVVGEETRRKRLLGAAISVTRYAIRMSSRSTPFGLYAGVAAAEIGEVAKAEIGPNTKKIVRIDSGWLDSLSRELNSSADLRLTLEVVLNNLCVERADRLIVPHVRIRREASNGAEVQLRGREISMRFTPLLEWICDRAHKPVRYSDLLIEAKDRFPRIPEQKLDSFLANLLARDVLLSKLPTTELYSTSLADAENILPSSLKKVAGLRGLREAMEAYAATSMGKGKDAWYGLRAAVSRVHDGILDVSPQVDVRADMSVTLPRPVIQEVEELASALWRIAPDGSAYTHMRRYRMAFLEKYGKHGVVRLKNLIDPHVGLGYPEGYLNPASTASFGINEKHKSAAHDTRAEILASLAYRGLSAENREVVLTEADVRRLSGGSSTPVPSQAVEVCFQLLGETLDSLDNGDFSLWVTPVGGALTAGAMAGRFSDVTDRSADLSKLFSTMAPNAIVAQVDFAPVLPRAMNVVQGRRFTEHRIPVGVFHGDKEHGFIDWRDLLVAADGNALRLYWEATGQQVVPIVPHTLSLTTAAPNLVRFLAELCYANEIRVWQPWEWGQMASLPLLPRVRFGRSIIAPLAWKTTLELRTAARQREDWETAVDEWRKRLNVDSRVRVINYDQYCEIDLDNVLHREILRRELTEGNPLVTEVPSAGGEQYGWLGKHCSEFTVPLVPREHVGRVKQHKLDHVRIKNSERKAYHPGSNWAYLELDCMPEIHDELIRRRVPDILEAVWGEIDRWFFIRYNRPRHHVRLRIRSNDPAMPESVWNRILRDCSLLREGGYISDFRLCTYEPELSRFGGVEGMDLAERVFHADSEWVINLMRIGRTGEAEYSKDLLELASYGIILDGIGDWDWCEWVAQHFPQRDDRDQPSRKEIQEAGRIVAPGMTLKNLAPVLPDSALESARRLADAAREVGKTLLPELDRTDTWTWREEIVGSFLHLHHNRLIGISPDRENRSLVSLRHIARMHQGRARHGVARFSSRSGA
ncbi:lantibiotic dehydratase [Streptomyces sp. HD]|uniref:lantibiotic dehydratase n=1 Tax=Streptomyces sp. HD TaxID=3020892 RepID=UPI00233126F0|nr:lantibiotic dehydratase [Streptomyces sp. HD]MDC0772867.1 lantibiotic dehydratase [Streptomyces sp. HD]